MELNRKHTYIWRRGKKKRERCYSTHLSALLELKETFVSVADDWKRSIAPPLLLETTRKQRNQPLFLHLALAHSLTHARKAKRREQQGTMKYQRIVKQKK